MASDSKPASSTAEDGRLTASCHCGRVQVEVPSKPTKLNECQCTVCYKYGAIWGYWVRAEVTIKSSGDGPAPQAYIRDDECAGGDISFNRCGHCGCMTHWWGEGENSGGEHKMGINCRLLPKSAIEGVERRMSSGPPSRS